MASGKGSGRVRELVSQQDIERRVAEIAAQLDADYAPLVSEAEPLIAIGVLKGSVFFLVDLLKRVKIPVALDFFQTSSYGSRMVRGEVHIRKDVDLSIRGRHVLLVEDIVDTGYTLRTIVDLLRFRGAASVKLCALLDKQAAREIEIQIDYRGFTIEPLFVVGYGLDFDERFRNLPYIGVWEPAAGRQDEAPAPEGA
jgi:hypoxanthine phosphoribosyltransferase